MTSLTRKLLLSSTLLLSAFSAQAQEQGYYHQAHANGDQMVFVSEGDLWRAGAQGSVAQRLTTHEEMESRPFLSPDGNWVAFNARYDGATEVYVMPAGGGAPKQVTYEAGGVEVRGWSPDGRILYTTGNLAGTRPRALRLANPQNGVIETLPLLDATDGVFSADGETLYFTRFGLGLSRDNVVQYRGGRVAQLWSYSMGSNSEAVRLAADFDAPIRDVMVWQNRVYFISDKSGADNIWSVASDGSDPQQHSNLSGWQMKSATMDNGIVTYQKGADIFRYDLSANSEYRVPHLLATDRDSVRERWLTQPLGWLSDTRMSGNGKSVALTARGRSAITFPGTRRRIELAIPKEARARAVTLSPNGKTAYAILDQGDRGEIWKFAADGRSEPTAITSGSEAHIWEIIPSPDGKSLVFDDKAGKLWHVALSTNSKTLIRSVSNGDDSPFTHIRWSKEGRYLTFSESDDRSLRRVAIHDTQTGKTEQVTTGKYESFAPTFSADGKWLYFVSNRTFNATPSGPWGDRNMGPQFDKRGKIYALQLTEDSNFPFRAKDELDFNKPKPKPKKDEGDGENADAEKKAKSEPEIIFDGLSKRLWTVPAAQNNYSALRANGGFIYAFVPAPNGQSSIKSIQINDTKRDIKTFATGVRRFDISNDGKTLFVYRGTGSRPTLALVPAKATMPKDLKGMTLRVGDWRLNISPQAEWSQMIRDAWRLHRDFAFDPNLRGVDWDAIGDQYIPLVERVGHRSELADLMGQMTANLGILHSQVGAGELPRDNEGAVIASLGAEYTPVRGGLQIASIYQSEADRPETLGPLLRPGVDIRVGDVLTAVDGVTVSDEADLYGALSHKAGQQIRVDYTRAGESLSEIVVPAGGRQAFFMRYNHWVEMNRRKVAEASDGKIGYLHLRAMGGGDVASFARDFYEHFDKDGIIIDVRGNNGGNIDSWILQTLLRQAWAFWQNPNGGEAYPNMQQVFRGHLAVLINEGTYSDGETFSAGVKALDLGPLIGTRTAGAGIWLSDRNRLVDGGIARVAEYPQFGLDGRWLVEGYGVEPDIEVVNPPNASFKGEDAQLDAAMAYLAEQMETNPVKDLVPGPIPPVGETGKDVE